LSTGLLFPSFRRRPECRRFWNLNRKRTWMPAFAGMTNFTSPTIAPGRSPVTVISTSLLAPALTLRHQLGRTWTVSDLGSVRNGTEADAESERIGYLVQIGLIALKNTTPIGPNLFKPGTYCHTRT
jgi:hypothetical protein